MRRSEFPYCSTAGTGIVHDCQQLNPRAMSCVVPCYALLSSELRGGVRCGESTMSIALPWPLSIPEARRLKKGDMS